jgi:hypothetical protein
MDRLPLLRLALLDFLRPNCAENRNFDFNSFNFGFSAFHD